MSNVIEMQVPSCAQCGALLPEESHHYFCRRGTHPTDMTLEQIELIDRLLYTTGAKLVFPDGQQYWCRIG